MRELTAAAATEAAKTTGAAPVYVLEMRHPGGTGYLSDQALTVAGGDPVDAAPRVLDWGTLRVEGEPEKTGQHATVTLKLADPDLQLKSLFEISPGVQATLCYLHLWFRNTAWSDRVVLLCATAETPLSWSVSDAQWTMTLRGVEKYFNYDVGEVMTRQLFPEINGQQAEGEIVPVVYGAPVYRVPCSVIDRPGQGVLAQTLNVVPDTTAVLAQTAQDGGFTSGATITLVVGWPGRWEALTGSFAASDTNVFTIASRSAVQASGTTGGFASAGIQYVALPDGDFADGTGTAPPVAASRINYPLFLQTTGGDWITTLVTDWKANANNWAAAVRPTSVGTSGASYKVGSQPGEFPLWPPGTPVSEVGDWTYAVNFLPSAGIERVEIKGTVQVPGGGQDETWLSINTAYWSYNLDDKGYNVALGRHPTTDPGITTVTTARVPTELGFRDETLWVTLNGTTVDKTGGGTALTNPADVIADILADPRLGGLAGYVGDFSAAAAAVSTVFAFALNETQKLHDLVTDLARQAGCVLFWDQGKAQLRFAGGSGAAVFTAGAGTTAAGTLQVSEYSLDAMTTQLLGRFKPAVPAPEIRFARKSEAAQAAYGRRREELDLWAMQYPTSVALTLEQWLAYRVGKQRKVEFEGWLDMLHVQPGDLVDLVFLSGDGSTILDTTALVIGVGLRPGSARRGTADRVQVTCEVTLWPYAVEVSVPEDASNRGGGGSARLLVQSQRLPVSGNLLAGMSVRMPRVQMDGGGNLAPVEAEPPSTGMTPLTPVGFLFLTSSSSSSSTGGKVYVGKTNAAIAKGAEGVVSRYNGATGADTFADDTCVNRFADVEASKWVAYTEDAVGGRYHLIAAEC